MSASSWASMVRDARLSLRHGVVEKGGQARGVGAGCKRHTPMVHPSARCVRWGSWVLLPRIYDLSQRLDAQASSLYGCTLPLLLVAALL